MSEAITWLTIFVLAAFVGIEVISKVSSTLHTPLMSGANAIHGIILVGAILVAGHADSTPILTLSLVAEPFEGDQVVDASGARLFLDSDAALLLDDKELDVAVDPSGDVQFAVADQLDFGMSEEY